MNKTQLPIKKEAKSFCVNTKYIANCYTSITLLHNHTYGDIHDCHVANGVFYYSIDTSDVLFSVLLHENYAKALDTEYPEDLTLEP